MGRQEESLWGVVVALVLSQVLSAGYRVVTQFISVPELHPLVLRLYGDAVALLVLFPAALIFDRQNPLRLSWRVAAKLFLLALIGVFGSQVLLSFGMERTNAGFSSLILQSVPVFTAIIALLFGVERLNLRRRDSRAKLAGAIFCCAGATVMTLYNGPRLLFLEPFHIGAACLIGSGLCMATFINLQVPLLKQHPAPVSVIAYSYLFGTLIMGVASYFLVVHDPSAWTVGWNLHLIPVLYNGIISSALYFGLVAWALSKVGPLFVASYLPIQPVTSTLIAIFFSKSHLYLGSVLGTGLVILGLSLVSWAHKEALRLKSLARIVERSGRFAAHTPDLRAPLLQADNQEQV